MAEPLVTAPTSFRLAQVARDAYEMPLVMLTRPHDSHPSIDRLVLLVFEAVLEVVCVSLPGYIVARLGHFDVDKQKFLANLNVMLFTPCLIFTKLASQLNAGKLAELAIIPVIFIIQTFISWCVAYGVSRACGFNRRASNFVTAMGVFGNSNSLPISLVLSLSQTLKGLHWDKIPGDNDDEVGARGILYLLIFQQLGQLVRWSWGYHVLLAPKETYPEYQEERVEEGRYTDEEPQRPQHRSRDSGIPVTGLEAEYYQEQTQASDDSACYEPAGRTPVAGTSRASPADSEDEDLDYPKKNLKTDPMPDERLPLLNNSNNDILSFPRIRNTDEPEIPEGWQGTWMRLKLNVKGKRDAAKASTVNFFARIFQSLPEPARVIMGWIQVAAVKVYNFLWAFMNPPLWAMLIAVVVASVPTLQRLFFEEGSFVKNSVTSAVKSSGGVAVPLILVVLGANLARNTQKRGDEGHDPEEEKIGTKLLVASLVSRMLLPTIIMAPILALMAKYVPVSILDDPIFVIVCFLLTGAPSALQLAQICQINAVFEGVMSNILFQSYVIWILPSTLILVMCALEVVEWANA